MKHIKKNYSYWICRDCKPQPSPSSLPHKQMFTIRKKKIVPTVSFSKDDPVGSSSFAPLALFVFSMLMEVEQGFIQLYLEYSLPAS